MIKTKKYAIFISSTYKDLAEIRGNIHDAILSDGHFPIAMENFTASSQPQWNTIKPLIDDCDYYILIVGFNYGSINKANGLSYTESEYEYAKSIGRPILLFILDKNFGLDEDTDTTKIDNFRKKILLIEGLAKHCNNKYNLSSDIVSALHNEYENAPQGGWFKYSPETYVGLSLEQIDKRLDDKEKELIELFNIKDTEKISFNNLIKNLGLSKQIFKFHIEHLEELQLLFHDNQYISDNDNYCELLPDGRKYLMTLLNSGTS